MNIPVYPDESRFCSSLFGLLVMLVSVTALAASSNELDIAAVPLSGQEIRQAFANVRDDAEVQDSGGTKAVNYWYSDGQFINKWHNGVEFGQVTGTWRMEKDKRCITVLTGLPERAGRESCNPIFKYKDKYFTFNSDGSVHGIHRLSPLSQER